ncbi:MAG: PrsW family glutamic-type intramembrane protease [Xanthobacteraceae bacterium]
MTGEQFPPTAEEEFHVSRGMAFPLLGGRSTWKQEHLLPIFLTLLVGLTLFTVPWPWPYLIIGGKRAPVEIDEAWQVFSILAIYIAFMVSYYVNQMCGRARPGWLLAFVALFTFLLNSTPVWTYWYDFFYSVIPGTRLEKSTNVVANAAGFLFGTGLCEEGFKALPLFALALIGAGLGWLAHRSKGKLSARLAGLRRRIGLNEPLDGIVLGVASGSGFFLHETLGQYLPMVMSQEKYPAAQAFAGMVLLLARGLPTLAEHSAWCGLFGYFIGLAVLQPRLAYLLVPLGWLSAAALHGAWDSVGNFFGSPVIFVPLLVADGLLSYALLAGAIFKARDISLMRTFGLREGKPGVVAPAAAIVAALPLAPVDD